MLTKFLKDTAKNKMTYSVTCLHPENSQQCNRKAKMKIMILVY